MFWGNLDFLMVFAVLCAYFVKGMCGFANTLVHSTILSFRENNINITPVELLVGYPSNVLIAWKERRSISFQTCLPLAALVLAGCIPGTFLLKNGNVGVVKAFFGFVVAAIGIEMLLREFTTEKKRGRKSLLVMIGLLSGLLCGMFGIGALMAAYMSRTTENSQAFKGNLCVVFLVENTFRLILYSVLGIITIPVIEQAAVLLPFMLIGLICGMGAAKIMKERIVKRAVIIMLILSGVSLVVSNL